LPLASGQRRRAAWLAVVWWFDHLTTSIAAD
jgi:hypothetical protein